MLRTNDLNFILEKTKLPLKELVNLIEEDRDYNLVIDSISHTLSEDDLNNLYKLSLDLRTKLILYNITRDKTFDIEEKSYISGILSKNFEQIYSRGPTMNKGQKKPINQFINILNSKTIDINKLSNIADQFKDIGHKDVGSHINEWVKIINNSKKVFSVIGCK